MEAQSMFSSIWGENGPSQLGMKSIWTVTDDEIENAGKGIKGGKGANKTVSPPSSGISQEVAKGGRLHMDDLFNQMEALEMERRATEATLRLASTPFRQTKRGQFDWSGLYEMLQDVRTQFKLYKEFTNTVERMREEADSMPDTISLSPVNMTALIFELFMNKKEEANALRQRFTRVLQKLYEDWESKMSAIDRVLFPTDENNNDVVSKLDVMPYLLMELTEVIRVSRIVLFTVQKRCEDARRRMTLGLQVKADSETPSTLQDGGQGQARGNSKTDFGNGIYWSEPKESIATTLANFLGVAGITLALGLASLFVSSFYILACWKDRYTETDKLNDKNRRANPQKSHN